MEKFYSKSALPVLLLVFAGLAFAPRLKSQDKRLLPLKVRVGDRAPDFSLPSAEGQAVKLSDFAGHNVLIDFYRGYW